MTDFEKLEYGLTLFKSGRKEDSKNLFFTLLDGEFRVKVDRFAKFCKDRLPMLEPMPEEKIHFESPHGNFKLDKQMILLLVEYVQFCFEE